MWATKSRRCSVSRSARWSSGSKFCVIAFGGGPGRGKTSAGDNASCRVSHKRETNELYLSKCEPSFVRLNFFYGGPPSVTGDNRKL